MDVPNAKLSMTMANSLYARARESVLYDKNFNPPKWGYLVILKKGPSFANLTDVQSTEVAKFIEKNLHFTDLPLIYFQARVGPKSGRVYFRMVEQFARQDAATVAAKERGYPSIWDVENEREIRL